MKNSQHTIQRGLSLEYFKFKGEIDAAIHKVLASGRYILGPELERFEKRFAKFTGFKYCVGVGNGYDGLFLSLKAMGDYDKVTVLNERHVATTNACTVCGCSIQHHYTGKDQRTYILLPYGRKIRDACREAHNFVKDDSELTVFSFHPLKVLHCYGDGGAVVTDDKNLYKSLRNLRNHGRMELTVVYGIGYNSRLDEIQAAVLNVMLDHIEELV